MPKNPKPDEHRNRLKFATLILLILGISFIVVSTAFSINRPTENAPTIEVNGGLRVTVTPANISLPGFLSGFAQVEITTQADIPFSNVTVNVIEAGHAVETDHFTYKPTKFAVSYIHLPTNLSGSDGRIEVQAQGSGSVNIPISWQRSYEGVLLAVALYSGIGAVCLSLAFSGSPKTKIWAFFPVFLILSIVFGQRYDDFFLISPGFRLISGVDPYKASSALLPGLQWAYPPFYLLWSYAVDKLYLLLPYASPISNSALNYLGTEFGNPYGAWKALSGTGLLTLYALIKLPLVLSFLWIFKIMKGLTGREHWKLWVFNPFVIVVAVLWGQLDVLAVAFLLQAILFDKSGSKWMAVLSASVGGAIKVFPLLIIPYIVVRSKNKLLNLTAMLPVVAAVLVIYYFTGGIFGSVYALIFARAVPTFGGAFVSNGFSWQVIISYLGITSFPSLFLFAFIPAFVILTWISIWKDVSLENYSTIIVLVFFVTYNFVNPQYLIWLIPLLVLIGRETYVILLSALGSAFMILTYSYTYFLNPQISWNYQSSALGQIENIKVMLLGTGEIRAVLAIIATAFFFYMLFKISSNSFQKSKAQTE